MFKKSDSKNDGIFSFIIGAAIGAAAGIIFTRYQDAIVDTLKDKYSKAKNRFSDFAEEAEDHIDGAKDYFRKKSRKVKDAIEDEQED